MAMSIPDIDMVQFDYIKSGIYARLRRWKRLLRLVGAITNKQNTAAMQNYHDVAIYESRVEKNETK